MSSERHEHKIATKSDWRIEPMPEENTTFELNRKFTDEQMQALMKGNIPKQMEDKWFWYYEDGKLYAHRSWTGICIYIIEFNNETGVHSVTVNRNPEDYGVTDVNEDLEILNSLLNWWTQPRYDYYHEWISETVNNLRKQGLVNTTSDTDEE